MKVFISWSGERSRLVGELLDDRIQCVLQAIDPWMSSKDIDRGSLWFSEITDQLKDTSIGIICLTQANKEKPWILFESGAMAKGLSASRVCTFLIDLEPSDIGNPLAQFNHSFPDRAGVWQLVRTLNSSLGEKSLKEKVLEKVFDTYWSQFEEGFKKIISETPNTPLDESKRTNDEMMLDVLSATRNIEKRLRSIETQETSVNRNHNLTKSEADALINHLLNTGLSEELILRTLSNTVPRNYLLRKVDQYKKDIEYLAVTSEA